jgi:hypothetical protein
MRADVSSKACLVLVAALVSAASTSLGGCVATVTGPPPRGVVVSGPPPAPINEERPVAPGPSAVWITGYWHWTGIQYAWIPGHWEASPPAGATWHEPRYVRAGGAYFYEPGGWRGLRNP